VTGGGDARLLMFHKPKGCVVTRADDRGRRTVYELLPGWVRTGGWVPVGRLDLDSRGLLLFARDGALVEALTGEGSPPKKYEVWVRGRVTAEHLERIRLGVETPVGKLACLSCELRGGAGPKTRLEVVLDEGRNRHIRRMFGALSDPERGTPLKVMDLKRTAVGSVSLDLPSGGWRALAPQEERALLGGGRG
jgi:23S rRNA pseudouridine2605 synthase